MTAPAEASAYRAHLLRGSTATLLSLGVLAASGGVFWLLAARLFPNEIVGKATALFSVTVFLVYLTNMGVPLAAGRYAVSRTIEDRARFCAGALYMSCVALVGACLLVAVAHSTTDLFTGVSALTALPVIAFAVVGNGLAMLTDVRLMALRRWGWVVARAAMVAAVRLPLLLWLSTGQHRVLWLYAAAVVPEAGSGFVGAGILGHGGLRHLRDSRTLAPMRRALRYATVQYLSQLTLQAPVIVIPVVVLLQVSPEDNAAFYVAWSIAMVSCLVPEAIAKVLFTEGKKDGAPLLGQVQFALTLAVGLMAVVTVAVTLGAGLVPVIYGDEYGDAAAQLPWLVGVSMAWAVTSVLIGRARVEEFARQTLTVTTVFAASCVIPAIFLVAEFGVPGATVAWIVGNAITAVVAVRLIGRRRVHRLSAPDEEPLPVVTILSGALDAETVTSSV